MTISKEHNLTLLRDILAGHHEDCCASVAEYEQANRVIDNLMLNHSLNADTAAILQEIQGYCQNGASLSSHDDHIEHHHESLSSWVDHIDGLS